MIALFFHPDPDSALVRLAATGAAAAANGRPTGQQSGGQQTAQQPPPPTASSASLQPAAAPAKQRIVKSVMFSDGIRPGCDLADLDTNWNAPPAAAMTTAPASAAATMAAARTPATAAASTATGDDDDDDDEMLLVTPRVGTKGHEQLSGAQKWGGGSFEQPTTRPTNEGRKTKRPV